MLYTTCDLCGRSYTDTLFNGVHYNVLILKPIRSTTNMYICILRGNGKDNRIVVKVFLYIQFIRH